MMIRKYSTKNILWKAIYSSTVGLPISIILTAGMIGFIYWVAHTQPWYISALAISAPFWAASVGRQFMIDYCYQRYNIDISPNHLFSLIGRLFK